MLDSLTFPGLKSGKAEFVRGGRRAPSNTVTHPETGKDTVYFSGRKAAMHLIDDIPHRNPDGTWNAVIEIPAGTVDKWETRKQSGALYRPKKDGRFRRVDYLPYPGNYGFVPRTLSDKALGGDGDAVDIIVIAPKVARGSVQKVRVIGAIRLLDEGEQDDKLVAVPATGPFRNIQDLADLKQTFPGVLEILETWFANYDGPGVTKIRAVVERSDAERILDEGHRSWQSHQP